jgi:hypothetical protein
MVFCAITSQKYLEQNRDKNDPTVCDFAERSGVLTYPTARWYFCAPYPGPKVSASINDDP